MQGKIFCLYFQAMRRLMPLLLIITILFLGGCSVLDQLSGSNSTIQPTETPTITPEPIPQAGATPNPEDNSVVFTDTITTTLTVWIPPGIYNATEAGTAVLESQLQTFQNTHPDITLVYEAKAVSGQGSILNYLRTGKNVAPNILPDLVAIPADQLNAGFNEDLFYSLNGLISSEELQDLYPAGLDIAVQEEQTRGYPFIMTDLPLLAFNNEVYTDTATTNWNNFITLPEQHFAFPANGTSGATLALQFYFAAGGSLTNEAGQQELQLEPLVTALQQFENGRQNEFIVSQSSNIVTLQDSWQLLENGTVTFVQTSGNQYLAKRNEEFPISPQAIPGIGEPLTPLVRGWVWAISTADPAKQELAAELIKLLTQSENLGEWSLASNHLPSRRSALNSWPAEDDYVPFVQEQLLQADLHPLSANSRIMIALGNAVFDVVSLTKTPQVAAEEAILSLQE